MVKWLIYYINRGILAVSYWTLFNLFSKCMEMSIQFFCCFIKIHVNFWDIGLELFVLLTEIEPYFYKRYWYIGTFKVILSFSSLMIIHSEYNKQFIMFIIDHFISRKRYSLQLSICKYTYVRAILFVYQSKNS